MKFLCIGQSAYDITLPVSNYPIENHKIKIGNTKVECGGGSANNCAYLLGKWGCDVHFITSVGQDIYGHRLKKELESVNVNTDNLIELEGIETTTSYIIANLSKGTRTIITNKDPLMKFNGDISHIKPDIIISDGNDDEVVLKTILNNPQAISILDASKILGGVVKLCRYVDYVVCSYDFARDYTHIAFKHNDLEKLKKVHAKLVNDFKTNVVITLEEFGSFSMIDGEYRLVPSISVKTLDTTGAGDIYHGAFAYFLSQHMPLYDVMRLSNIAGALSTTKIGSKNSMPALEEVINYDAR